METTEIYTKISELSQKLWEITMEMDFQKLKMYKTPSAVIKQCCHLLDIVNDSICPF